MTLSAPTRLFLIILVQLFLTSCNLLPTPFTPHERAENLKQDVLVLDKIRPPLPQRLSLNHAIARALKYNIDYRIKQIEQAIAQTDMSVSNLNMLPNLIAHAGYVARSNTNEVLSPSTGLVSTAEDRFRRLADLSFSWNILDFGVSYFESKQKADQVLIAEHEKRKIMQRITKDTRKAYWRAYAASRYLAIANDFDDELKTSIHNAKVAADNKLMSSIDAARYQRDLWLLKNQIINLHFELARFKPELMGLISASTHTKSRLTPQKKDILAIEKLLPERLDKLEQLALYYRPELQQENYRKRIGLNEINKARLRMLPGFEINYGSYYDSNSYLVNNTWNQLSLSLSWNIIKMMSNAKSLRLAEQQTLLTEIRRAALSVAIVTQVDIAKLSLMYSKENLYTNEKILENERAIYKTLIAQQNNFESKFTLTKAHAAVILAQLKRDLAYADYQTAMAELIDSIGLNPVYNPSCVRLPLKELTQIIEKNVIPTTKQKHIEAILKKYPSPT